MGKIIKISSNINKKLNKEKNEEIIYKMEVIIDLIRQGMVTNIDLIFNYDGETMLISDREGKVKYRDLIDRVTKNEISIATFKNNND